MSRTAALSALALALAASLAPAAHAAQSYDGCKGFITSLPTTITTQGVWCFNKDLATTITSGAAITVATNNVTIDCNDFKMGGLSAGPGTDAAGIRSTDRLNVTVRNCNIRGFAMGVDLGGETTTGGHVVADNRFEGNTLSGIGVAGDGSTVRGNVVLDTGGSTISNDAGAIVVNGRVDVLDNTVDGVAAMPGTTGRAAGIFVVASDGGTIGGNRIRAISSDPLGGYAGIYAEFAGNTIIAGNNLATTDVLAEMGAVGIFCGFGSDFSRVRDNTVIDFPVGIINCGDGGGNDVNEPGPIL